MAPQTPQPSVIQSELSQTIGAASNAPLAETQQQCRYQLDHHNAAIAATENKAHISKKYFHPGGVAPSEWTRSVRAVRDTPVAEYSTRGLNTTCHVAYRPPIAVSRFILALSVSYFKWTFWRWRPTVTIRSIQWVHWARICIGIARRWVTLRKPLHAFLLPTRKMQFSLY